MKTRQIIITFILTGILAVTAFSVSAQEGGRNRHRRGNFMNAELLETYTGLTREEIRTALQGGATIASLIEANGESVDAFIAEVVAQFQAHLDELVTEGTIDEATAAERLATFEENITERVNTPIEFGNRGGRNGQAEEVEAQA